MSSYIKKLAMAILFCATPVVSNAQEFISHSEMEERMAQFGQSPRDLGAEVVKMCRIIKVPNQESRSSTSRQRLLGSSTYEPCPDNVLSVRQQQVSELRVEQPNFDWKIEIAYQWIPLIPLTVNSRAVRSATVNGSITVTIDGDEYPLGNDRETLAAYDQCEWVAVPGTNHIARKPGCQFEPYISSVGGGMQITISNESQDASFRNCSVGLPVRAADGTVTRRSHADCG